MCGRCLRARSPTDGELTPVAWRHRSERYGEKLATPDTSRRRPDRRRRPDQGRAGPHARRPGDRSTTGWCPRTNRGIVAINELPDLAERIQVALLNVLEERDIQVRGYQLRLPLDLLLVASANPEDYTNRGRIITPLKDRFGAEVRTHYPLELDDELALIAQEAAVLWTGDDRRFAARRSCPRTCSRWSPGSPATCATRRRSTSAPGVSARFAIAAVETVAASAVRRAAVTGEPIAVARVADLPSVDPGLARQGRVRRRGRGPRVRGARAPAAPRDRRDLPGAAGRARPASAAGEVRRRA